MALAFTPMMRWMKRMAGGAGYDATTQQLQRGGGKFILLGFSLAGEDWGTVSPRTSGRRAIIFEAAPLSSAALPVRTNGAAKSQSRQ